MLADKDWLKMSKNTIVELASSKNPLVLDCGKSIGPIKTAYTTYGKLNDSNRMQF